MDSSQGDEQVVDMDHGTTGRDPHDIGIRVHLPAFAGAREDNVVVFRIDQDVFNALQARQIGSLHSEEVLCSLWPAVMAASKPFEGTMRS